MADAEALTAPRVQHLVCLIVSSDGNSSAAGRDHWADFKGQEKNFLGRLSAWYFSVKESGLKFRVCQVWGRHRKLVPICL